MADPWKFAYITKLFDMTYDSQIFISREIDEMQTDDRIDLLRLYEAKMVHIFDHRRNHFRRDDSGAYAFQRPAPEDKVNPSFEPSPRYWVAESEVLSRMADRGWTREWLFGWRNITNSTNERTIIAAFIPYTAVGNTFHVLFVDAAPKLCMASWAYLDTMVFDFVARQKLGGTHLTIEVAKQLPVLPPSAYSPADLDFIAPRVLKLTYTSPGTWPPFARDLGYDGEPFRWDPEQRALLRAELDAYYAYLYGLSKKELRYILDPKDVMGEDYPSETFRVLKENEMRPPRSYGEYRTRRLVLEAYDRFARDGTFDPARLEDPEYFPVVREALAVSKSREQELEQALEALVARSDREALPTLFVEGTTDKLIVEGAWRALYPGEPLPFSVLAAGGTTQMRSLATPGKAMRELLGDRLVMALADNDAEGRGLWDEGNLHKGGVWKPQTNGVHWCLLKPSDEFTAVMERFQIPSGCWPFTIENAFPAALRRQALAEGAYAFADHKVQSDLTRDPDVAQKIVGIVRDLDQADDAYFYLMAPSPQAKDAFAAWVTDPARLTPANFAAFEIVLSRLKDLLARHAAPARGPQPQQQTA